MESSCGCKYAVHYYGDGGTEKKTHSLESNKTVKEKVQVSEKDTDEQKYCLEYRQMCQFVSYTVTLCQKY